VAPQDRRCQKVPSKLLALSSLIFQGKRIAEFDADIQLYTLFIMFLSLNMLDPNCTLKSQNDILTVVYNKKKYILIRKHL